MFNIFKKKQESTFDSFVVLKDLLELLPEFYRIEPGFSDCVQLTTNRDLNAVESLIALTKVEGHYFSDEFWKDLLKCAQTLDLSSQASYCSQQIEKNAKELKQKLPKGWSTVKSGDSSYSVYIAQSIKDGWDEERRRKDNVPKLLKKNGFHLANNGRAGTIYYVKDGQLIEIGFEMSGVKEYDILISFNTVTHYVLPNKVALSESEKSLLKSELIEWLNEKRTKAQLY